MKAENNPQLADAARQHVQRARSRADAAAKRGDWLEAEEHLSGALNVVDENAGLLTFRSLTRLKQQKVSHALADAQQAANIAPSAHAHYRVGRAMLAGGQAERRALTAGGAMVNSLGLAPSGMNAAVVFDETLVAIRRERAYWPGRAPKAEPTVLSPGAKLSARPPAPCAPPAVSDASHSSLAVSWQPPLEDGGDDIWQYELELAAIDPLYPAAELAFAVAYAGRPEGKGEALIMSTRLSGLDADAEYAVRVAASNGCGRSEWSAATRASTLTRPVRERQLDTVVPTAWLELRPNMCDLATSLEKKYGTSAHTDWHALVRVWAAQLARLRLAYRMYVLLGNTEEAPKDISLTQFRRFVEDCHVLKKGSAAKVDTDLIFTRVNRTVNNGGLSMSGGGAEGASREDTSRMGQDEFVHALVRLGLLRAEQRGGGLSSSACPSLTAASLAASFEALVEECVKPHASFVLNDELSVAIQGRGVRAALAKHHDALRRQYTRWATTDKAVGSSSDSMSLQELLIALKEAKVLDERCTAREVTRFFVMVNADDEIYVSEPSEAKGVGKGKGAGKAARQKGAAELDFDEFNEIVCRICDQKCPAQSREGPFENTLDTWLRLFFLPALRNAGRGVVS